MENWATTTPKSLMKFLFYDALFQLLNLFYLYSVIVYQLFCIVLLLYCWFCSTCIYQNALSYYVAFLYFTIEINLSQSHLIMQSKLQALYLEFALFTYSVSQFACQQYKFYLKYWFFKDYLITQSEIQVLHLELVLFLIFHLSICQQCKSYFNQ